ncbi:MAG: nicotinamide-nucleotide amidohydrolase family protein [Spirochaetales bacterium]|nr:nicotinamide-nucleotide amidohydrolase family protein [Spirochaetales bacterium]
MVRSFLNGYLDNNYHAAASFFTTWTAFLVPESVLEDTLSGICGPGEKWRTRAEGHRIVFELEGPESSFTTVEELKEKFGAILIREGEKSAAQLLADALLKSGKVLVCAESCTGGLIGKMITDLPGSSNVFWGSLVTYANEAKRRLLSVSALDRYGAVSRETVVEMAEGAIVASGADIAIAVSGIAGPDGGSEEKPVGTVWIAVKTKESAADAREFRFRGDRERVRLRAAVAAMLLAESHLTGVGVDSDIFSTYT